MSTRAGGPPAYVTAHRIAVIDGRLPFAHAYCLTSLVFDHAGGPATVERKGTMSLRLCKELAAQDLVLLTTEMRDDSRATVRLTMSDTLLDELGTVRPGVVVQRYFAERRPKPHRFVEVTQPGLDLVDAAFSRR